MMLQNVTALFDSFSSLCFDAPSDERSYNHYACEYIAQPKSSDMPEAILAVAIGILVIVAAALLIRRLRRKKASPVKNK